MEATKRVLEDDAKALKSQTTTADVNLPNTTRELGPSPAWDAVYDPSLPVEDLYFFVDLDYT